jgi:hypothetical protein
MKLDADLAAGSSQKRMVLWLLGNLEHYSPDATFAFTSQQVSSRVERFFETLKTRIEYARETLADLVCAVWGLARTAFAKQLCPRAKPICGADILDVPLQFRLGRGSANTLRKEVALLRGWNWFTGALLVRVAARSLRISENDTRNDQFISYVSMYETFPCEAPF